VKLFVYVTRVDSQNKVEAQHGKKCGFCICSVCHEQRESKLEKENRIKNDFEKIQRKNQGVCVFVLIV